MKTPLRLIVGMLLLATDLSAGTLYVSKASVNPAPPYATWATAATNIQDAVNAAVGGDILMVTNGVYSGGLLISNTLTILSANGPEFTTIDGGGTNRCMAVSRVTSMSGFTLTNGWTLTDGGGVWSPAAGAFLTNCILSGNCASNGGGAYEGVFYSCLLTGNCASNGSGGAAFVSELHNCTLAGNSAARGGGAYYGWLYNCILYYNSAPVGSNYASTWGMTNCCTMPDPGAGEGNITSAPLFVDYAGGNLHLQSTSPCIDAGNNAYAYGTTDLDGNQRISGSAVDIGAYQFQQPSPPVITLQPVSQTVYAGSKVDLTVGISGSLPLSWRWQFNGTAVPNATDSKLTLLPVSTNQAGGYSVIVTNSFGAITSQVAVLTVIDSKPSITVQPVSQTAYAGDNVTLTISAVGSLPLAWQWQFNGGPIPSATASSLALASVTTSQQGGYSAVVFNSLGAVTSQVAVLTVLPGHPPSITLQPLNQFVLAGSSVTFTADASGLMPLHWQWLFNGSPVQDATNSSLKLTAVTIAQAGIYSVIVTNFVGSATSTNATLVVRVPGTKYVWQNSTNPTPPFSNWATAAQTIQDAVDLAFAGDEIVVSNGIYATGGRMAAGGSLTNRVVVDKAVTIRSVNGPGMTVIQGYQIPAVINGKAAIRCVYLAGGAVLNGFTLTGGATGSFSPDWSPYEPYGGGASCASTNAVITNCVLTGNASYGPGAGVSGGTLNNCTLSGNSGAFGGGAANSTLNGCILSSNSARMGGGASQATLQRCTLSGNSASEEGGGAADSVLNNCNLTGNSGDIGGGAYQGTINNCTLTGNSASQGGATYQSTLNNCTITGNSATSLGGGAYSCSLTNCIVYYNAAPTGPNYYGGCTFLYSCTTPLPAGAGNIDAEPLLASATHLSAQSPCIGRGASAYASGVDIDGEAWLNPPCMGADQFVAGQTLGPLVVGISAGYTNVAAGFALPFRALIEGQLSGSVWDFGDGVVVSNRPYLSHSWATPGDYAVRLTGFNDAQVGGVSSTLLVHVGAVEVYYANVANATPSPPYTNWTGAANTIQDAIDAGTQMGRLVLVADGLYATGGRAVSGSMTNRVVVTEGVEVRSVNGPTTAVISGAPAILGGNGDGAVRCAYVGANAVLNGFTLTNGRTRAVSFSTLESSGGGAWCEVSGVMTNCNLSGNVASYMSGGVYGGTLNGCVLSGNSAGWGGGASGSPLNHCTVTANSAGQGGGAADATLNNCTLSGNSAQQGGGAQGGTLNNCILTANWGSWGGGAYESSLNNCVLTGNSANQGGGIYSGTGASVLNNCTLTGNSATNSGGGAYSGVLNNCIVYYNVASAGPNYFNGSTFNYSCATPLPAGVGNIELEPQLASAAHLSAQSPCIGRGSAAYSSGVDIDGEAWQNPPCMGADQFMSGPTTGPLTISVAAGYTNVGTGFAVSFRSLIAGRLAASAWDFGDGVVVSNRPYASHAWTAPGDYTVQLTGFSDSYPGGVSATVLVRVAGAEVFYVNAGNATPAPPYATLATAATNIQDAIDAGSQIGRLVLVSQGVYASGGRVVEGLGTNRVVITEGVELRSVDGPNVTLILGAARSANPAGVRCVYVGANAILNGFTLTNGNAFSGYVSAGNGGGAWCEGSGVVTNCTLTGNSASNEGGGAYGGTINGCILSSNVAYGAGGAAQGATLNNCVLTGNSGNTGGGAAAATLNKCILSGNSCSGAGAGAFASTLNNCILSGNSAGGYGGGGAWGSTLNNCVLTGNSAGFNGPAVAYCSLNNCTVTGSSAPGAAVSGGTLNNCIVYFNNGDNYTSYSVLNYCCTTPIPPNGVGNITNAPLFVDSTGGNFHLQSTSPCINAGTNGLAPGATDLDGNPRIVGGRVDIGAYEFQGSSSVIPLAWLQHYGLGTDGSADFVDTDGDGMNNWQEWVCGTNPTNALSVLRLLSTVSAGSNVTVTWQSVAGINYFLERGANLGAPFVFEATNIVGRTTNFVYIATNCLVVATNIAGQTGTTSYTDTNATGAGPFFYRVGVKYP